MAKMFADAGLKRLHLVDLDGARSRHIVNTRTLESIAGNTDLIIDFGGGVKSRRDIDTAFDCGASMVIVGSTAITDRELMYEWIEEFGEDRIILGADVRNGLISVNGWKEDSDLKLDDFLKEYRAKGITRVLCTDINRDGMLQGPATELYRSILRDFPGIKLIASGGVSSIEDLIELRKEGLYEAIVGKAYYEGKITLKQLAEF
jgi:phosphoribosylformimino-5-aminoimidazole carboxamide ribotide isomerase